MAELLLVRSGETDSSVTKRVALGTDELKQAIGARALHYLGTELPPIGETSRIAEFSDPDHVVLNVGAGEPSRFGLEEPGFYLVEELGPAEFMQS